MLADAGMTAIALTLSPAVTTPLKCGVASDVFHQNPSTAATALSTPGFTWWWNWKAEAGPLPASAASLRDIHVPMVWGDAIPASIATPVGSTVLMWNEPDQYGPSCCNCDGKQTYAAATSAGWLPLFNPVAAAPLFAQAVAQLSALKGSVPGLRLASPAMAGAAAPEEGVDCSLDPAVPPNSHYCQGWLRMFKEQLLQVQCSAINGSASARSCWDEIEVIQIHAYARTAEEVLGKVRDYYAAFKDDFEGANGRSKKTLWLTEVAAASSDASYVSQFVDELMNSASGLTNRAPGPDGFGYVERVSWFSEMYFPGFDVPGHPIEDGEMWTSSLFNPFGSLSEVGETFFSHCSGAGRGGLL